MMSRYATMTYEDFGRLLAEVIDQDNPTASDLLTVPGVHALLSEHYNNAVLEAWDAEHPEAQAAAEPEDE